MECVDRHKDDVVVFINELDHLLSAAADVCTEQAGKRTYAVVDVNDIVTDLDLTELFERKGELSRACTIALKRIFMEAVEDLMVCEDTYLGRVVYEAFVKRGFYGCEVYLVAAIFEDSAQTFDLLFVVAEYVDRVAVGSQTLKRLADKIEILVIDALRRTIEVDRSLCFA